VRGRLQTGRESEAGDYPLLMQTQTVIEMMRFGLNLIYWFRLATYAVLSSLTIDEGRGDRDILFSF
jgi:hypothetical protein